jgi:hypothetical protein
VSGRGDEFEADPASEDPMTPITDGWTHPAESFGLRRWLDHVVSRIDTSTEVVHP